MFCDEHGTVDYCPECDKDYTNEINAKLVEALECMLQANKCKELPSPHWVKSAEAKAKEALKQAKGGE